MTTRRNWLRMVAAGGAGLLAGCTSFVESTEQEDELTQLDTGGGRGGFGEALTVGDDLLVATAVPEDRYRESKPGAAFVFERGDDQWSQQAELTAPTDEIGTFGASVAVTAERVVVGAPSATGEGGDETGAVHVFERETEWQHQATLTPDDGRPNDRFGSAVAAVDGRIVVGAQHHDVDGRHTGAAYVFEPTQGKWSQAQKLVASDGDAGDSFGYDVAATADRLFVSAVGEEADGGASAGAVYVFQPAGGGSGGNWSQQAKLTAEDGESGDSFGISLAVDADRLLVGAYADANQQGTAAGTAYEFAHRNGGWAQRAKLVGDDVGSEAYFGSAVGLSEDVAVVGAQGAERGDAETGAAYLFERDGDGWQEETVLAPDDLESGAWFGHAVALDGDRVAVGAPEQPTDDGTGAVYVDST